MPIPTITNRQFEAVPLQELKLFLREDRDINDALIRSLGQAAEKMIHRETGLCISRTDFEVQLDGFKTLRIPFSPLKESSISISYTDPSGTSKALSGQFWDAQRREITFSEDAPEAEEVTISFSCGGAPAKADHITALKLITLILFNRQIPSAPDKDIKPLQVGMIKDLLFSQRSSYFH